MRYDAVDLSRLAPPDAIEVIAYEDILAARLDDLRRRWPAYDVGALETDPLAIDQQVGAYREMLVRARVNDGVRATLLAFATGADLEHLAAEFGVARLMIDPGDAGASPPRAPTYESDDQLRARRQLAVEALTTAGTEGAYLYQALSAHDADMRRIVKSAQIYGPSTPALGVPLGHVQVVALGYPGAFRVVDTLGVETTWITPEDGVLPAAAVAALRAHLVPLAPVADFVDLVAASAPRYAIEATLRVGRTPRWCARKPAIASASSPPAPIASPATCRIRSSTRPAMSWTAPASPSSARCPSPRRPPPSSAIPTPRRGARA
jgi:hypothetical protein